VSFFSPISKRSGSVRLILNGMYVLLAAGALTMILPLILTFSGSMAGVYDLESVSFYPKFLVSEKALWGRYLDARYGGELENFKMAWSDPTLDFYDPPYAPHEDGKPSENLRLWDEFLAERGLSPGDAGLAFTRPNRREAALENRNFRLWLLKQYDGSLARVNEALSLEVPQATAIIPPRQSRITLVDVRTPLEDKLVEYMTTLPLDRRLPWDVGGFYRAVFLPRIFGEDVAAYNAASGTSYASYAEVPFPATMPAVGGEPWSRFVREILNPGFVELTPEGEAAWQASGRNRVDFVRSVAQPEHLKVTSVDHAFAEWAAKRGVADARIPQRAADWRNFQAAKGFWRWQFATQNYVYVLDEVMIQGNGVRNTAILVVLTVVGALTVNPMAAYALSRFRLRQTYQVLLFFLATIAFPAEVAMIPNFLMLKELGLLNTFGALVLPGLVNGFSIFLLKGFFDSLPKELYEAADIDGANEWQIFWGFTMNLSKPILAVIALNAFIGAYSAFFFALILAPDQNMWTLMVWIYQLRQTAGPGIVYASLLITAVPTLVVYLCAQNVILRGIVVPSEK
jgi:multiple sugar transport system permease protein